MSKGDYWKILEEAISIAKEREQQHGSYLENFQIFEMAGYEISKGIEAIMLLKMGRLLTKLKKGKPIHADDYLDLINYAAMRVHSENSKNSKK